MAEPTLALQLSDLQAEVGFYLGWGRGAAFGDTAWTSQQQTTLDYITKSGLRQFYYPPPLEGQSTSYDWSFLKPTAQLALVQGGSIIPLPDDYGGFEGDITVAATAVSTQPWLISWENEGRIRQRQATYPSMTGPPMYVGEQWLKGTSPNAGQRAQLLVFPTADQAYTVQVPYYINPDYLTSQLPYALGGAQHSETIVESCLAVAEQRLDDASGVHAARFQERLAASIAMDRKSKPQRLGYNADRSDRPSAMVNPHYWAPAATYNGQSFT